MNEESSRSHAVCTITFSCYSANDSSSCTAEPMYTSKVQLVDLAGSERLSQTFSRTTKETCQINKGLHALSNVIMALSPLSPAPAAPQHVPYRDSKLTRVLQDALGGSARTVLIACVSPADESVNETLSTLQYATRARRIQSRPAPAAAAVSGPDAASLTALQRMQWVLLRRHLASVGLMPIPEVLMKVCRLLALCTVARHWHRSGRLPAHPHSVCSFDFEPHMEAEGAWTLPTRYSNIGWTFHRQAVTAQVQRSAN